MLGWFRPSLPVDAQTQAWVDFRMAWLVGQFGWERLRRAPVVLPTDEFFPDAYDGGPYGAQQMLERVCGYMDVDPQRVDLRLFSEHGALDQSPVVIVGQGGAPVGMYHEDGGRFVVWLGQSTLADPLATAATLAHELAHVRLLGERRLSSDEEDHELLTDLATVFFGLGVILANASLRERQWRAEGREGWSLHWQGYLTAPVFGYALALFADWRQEPAPAWARHLRPDARAPFHQSRRVLEQRRGAALPVSVAQSVPLSPLLKRLASRSRMDDSEGAPEDAPAAEAETEDYVPDDAAPQTADAWFTHGLACAEEGRYAEAVHAFSEAIRLDPDDGESYHHRAAALIELDRSAEALADAETALQSDPDDWNARRTRGLALLREGEYRRAIADFDQVLRDRQVDLMACYYRGEAWARLAEYRKAVQDFTRVINHSPQWSEPLVARGLCYELLGKKAEAERDRRAAERLHGG